MGAYTTLTSKGQLTIPKDVRDKLNLETGARFYICAVDGEVHIMQKNLSISDLAGILHREGQEPVSLEEIDKAIGEYVAADDRRIMREWNEGRESRK